MHNNWLEVVAVRHAEATHNVAASKCVETGEDPETVYVSWEFEDAELTESGREQARGLQNHPLVTRRRFDQVWLSPLTRAIDTARSIFSEANQEGRPFVHAGSVFGHEILRERTKFHPANKRKTTAELKRLHPSIHWSHLKTWGTTPDTQWETDEGDLSERCAELRRFFLEETDPHVGTIMVVSHETLWKRFFQTTVDHPSDKHRFRFEGDWNEFGNADAKRFIVSRSTQGFPCWKPF